MLLSSRRISTHEEHLALKDIPSYFVTQFLNGPEGSRKENSVPSQHFLPPRRISLLPLSQTQWTACPPLVLIGSAAMTPAGPLPVLRLVDPPPSLMPSLIGKCAGDALSGSVAIHFPSLVRCLLSPGRGVRFDGISGLGKVGWFMPAEPRSDPQIILIENGGASQLCASEETVAVGERIYSSLLRMRESSLNPVSQQLAFLWHICLNTEGTELKSPRPISGAFAYPMYPFWHESSPLLLTSTDSSPVLT